MTTPVLLFSLLTLNTHFQRNSTISVTKKPKINTFQIFYKRHATFLCIYYLYFLCINQKMILFVLRLLRLENCIKLPELFLVRQLSILDQYHICCVLQQHFCFFNIVALNLYEKVTIIKRKTTFIFLIYVFEQLQLF